MEIGKEYHGFELKKVENIDEISSVAKIFQHKQTGAKLLYLENDDENKVFSIGFKTPINDKHGAPHILEHCVLNGSKNYPIKDPFKELMSSSLHTFLNAVTFPDKTVYPLGSKNNKDFSNLVGVYLDAVFYPKIVEKEEIFLQEGWHYDISDIRDDLKYNGVVYNEMKGLLLSPEIILYGAISKSLYPRSIYAYEAGGDPEYIPRLTHKKLVDYYKKYYHPSNSYIFFYGKIDIQEKLKFLNENYLKDFRKKNIDFSNKVKPVFSNFSEKKVKYAISKDESMLNKSFLSLNFSIDKNTNKELYIAFQILTYILVEAEGAPLKEALLKKGIGESIHVEFVSNILQPIFYILARNSNSALKQDFTKTVFLTLENLVKKGIDKELLQGAINQMEFVMKEMDTGIYPKGLAYNFVALSAWMYGDDPTAHLKFKETFDGIKRKSSEGFFEDLIDKYLLKNKHYSLVLLEPDKYLLEKKDRKNKENLKKHQKSLSKIELNAIVKKKELLNDYQKTPDSPENMAKIPKLSLSDVDKDIEEIPMIEKNLSDSKILYHPIDTNDILYTEYFFETKHIPLEQLQYLSLMTKLLSKLETEKYGYKELNNLINQRTGGISFKLGTFSQYNKYPEYNAKFILRAKCLLKEIEHLFNLIPEILHNTKFSNKNRVKEIIQILISDIESDIFFLGDTMALKRVYSYFSQKGMYEECISGVSYYHFLKDLIINFDTKWDELQSNFLALQKKIFSSHNLVINITVDKKNYNFVEKYLKKCVDSLDDKKYSAENYNIPINHTNEGFAFETDVQYVAKGYNLNLLNHRYSGVLRVLCNIFDTGYLWDEIRDKGGAYTSSANLLRDGTFIFTSYRDPNIKETLDVYNRAGEFLKSQNFKKGEIEKFIIGTIGSLDKPLTPFMKGYVSSRYYLSNITNKDLQNERHEVLNTKGTDIIYYSEIITNLMQESPYCVLGSKEKLQKNQDLFTNIVDLFK